MRSHSNSQVIVVLKFLFVLREKRILYMSIYTVPLVRRL